MAHRGRRSAWRTTSCPTTWAIRRTSSGRWPPSAVATIRRSAGSRWKSASSAARIPISPWLRGRGFRSEIRGQLPANSFPRHAPRSRSSVGSGRPLSCSRAISRRTRRPKRPPPPSAGMPVPPILLRTDARHRGPCAFPAVVVPTWRIGFVMQRAALVRRVRRRPDGWSTGDCRRGRGLMSTPPAEPPAGSSRSPSSAGSRRTRCVAGTCTGR